MKKSLFLLFTGTMLCGLTVPAFGMSDAEMLEKFQKMENMIRKQQQQIEQQQRTIDSLQQNMAAPAGKTVTLPAADKEKLKQAVASVIQESKLIPGWLSGLKYSGDLRLRYEGLWGRDDRDDRHRGRYRMRLNFAKKLGDEVNVIFRLASADGPSITSSNSDFDEAFSKKGIWIDRAYATYKPKWLRGLELGAGKLKNPLIHTDIVWDSDINPEGAFQKYTLGGKNKFKPFLTLAQLFIYENNSTRDATLFVYQGGFNWKLGNNKWTLAAGYYDYNNLEDSRLVDSNAKSNTVIIRNGKERLECGFRLVNLTTFWQTKVAGRPLKLYADFVRNIASNCDDNDKAWAIGFSYGKARHKGDWAIGAKYGFIESDAVVAAFADANFGNSNTKGGKFSLKYKFHPQMLFAATCWFYDTVHGHDDDIFNPALDVIFKW